tara:strand:+ start:2554 stop:3750 length:1197 start_codon:yes stop_codon:yes gene_type:complete
MRKRILSEINKILADTIETRHLLHQIPEESFKEKDTASFIAEKLRALNLSVTTGLEQTGVTATISGVHPGNTVSLRADMDALPIQETTTVPYTSKRQGYSHSCGHDGHVACLLGTARVLVALRDQLSGSVRFIFQPGEESGSGALTMINAGVLKNPRPVAVFAIHAWPGLPTGSVASMPGFLTAACSAFTITVKGKGGHGARPHMACSPILGAARVVQSISALSGTEKSSSLPCIASVGSIHGGMLGNVIPNTTIIKGTIRFTENALRPQIEEKLKSMVHQACIEEHVVADVAINSFSPAVYNHPTLYKLFEAVADNLLGEEKLAIITQRSMGSEDFAYYAQQTPGLLIRLGMGKSCAPLHTGNFDFSDHALVSGIAVLTGLSLKASNRNYKIKEGML